MSGITSEQERDEMIRAALDQGHPGEYLGSKGVMSGESGSGSSSEATFYNRS